ncbi:MAG: dihydrofolate synthase [Frankiales bacterium]|nr:dihydrofolate synthase [Frankiales bacterium]
MSVQSVMAALAGRFPSEDRMVPDLERIRLLMHLMGDPQRSYPSIHLTGTNGKTSTARMIDTLLQGFGLRTGRYTSPHLVSPTERITLDGEPLSAERFGEVFDEVLPIVELVDARSEHPMTFFEVLTGMGFWAFADAPVDVAVLEVGLGGTWDATNVVDAQTCVVLPVGLDHVPLLGTTVAEVAAEKAGIITEGAMVLLAAQPPEAAEVLLRRCVEVSATVAREGLEYGVLARRTAVGGQLLDLQGLGGRYDEIFLPLHGAHQATNAASALAAVEAFLGAGTVGQLDVDLVRSSFLQATSPGRLEVLRSGPTVMVDAAHNPAGMVAAVEALTDAFAFTSLTVVLACLADKDVRGMLEVLDGAATHVVVTQTSSPRAMPAEDLRVLAEEILGADRVEIEDRLDDAIDTAVRLAEEGEEYGSGGVLVTGSVVTAGEARLLLAR